MGSGILELYAEKRGWSLRKANILVEGTSDREYFELASALVRASTGKQLVGDDLTVFPPGEGDDGGAPGIQEQFPIMRQLADDDLGPDMKRRFRVVALLDGDSKGKGAARSMVATYRRLLLWQDVFILHRVMPQRTHDPRGLEKHVAEANSEWGKADTVIEDLVARELHELFYESDGRSFVRDPSKHPESLPPQAKAPFLRFVKAHGDLDTVAGLVGLVRSMRFYLRLPVDGV